MMDVSRHKSVILAGYVRNAELSLVYFDSATPWAESNLSNQPASCPLGFGQAQRVRAMRSDQEFLLYTLASADSSARPGCGLPMAVVLHEVGENPLIFRRSAALGQLVPNDLFANIETSQGGKAIQI